MVVATVVAGAATATAAETDTSSVVTVDIEELVAATELPEREVLQQLVDEGGDIYFSREPIYRERLTVLADQIVINRSLRFDLAPGICSDPSARSALGDLCITIDDRVAAPTEVAADLAEVRDRLGDRDPSSRVAAGVTAAEALTMTDHELLDLVLNGGRRTIKRVTTVPIHGPTVTTGTASLFSQVSDAQVLDPQLATDSSPTSLTSAFFYPQPHQQWNTATPEYDTQYFMTGFTLTEEIRDRWEYTIADSSWWHGRYYVRFDYAIGARIGARVPFELDVEVTSGDHSAAEVELTVDTVDVDPTGLPAYPATGYDGPVSTGKEFMLEVLISCRLKLSIPGPDHSRSCSDAGIPTTIDMGRNVVPVLGDERSVLDEWVLPGETTGLHMQLGPDEFKMAWASIDLGVRADISNGRIGFQVDPHDGTQLTGTPDGVIWRNNTDPMPLSLTRESGTANLGFTVTDPHYSFELGVTPTVTFNAGVDVRIFHDTWSETFDLDFLRIEKQFELNHHHGTVGQHDYTLGWNDEFINEPAPSTDPTTALITSPIWTAYR